MLKVDNLSKSYSRNKFLFFSSQNNFTEAIKEISFEIESGDILGIVGQNGSGKTTLLKTIFGTITQDSGEVTLGSKRGNIKNNSVLLNNNDRSFFWRLTVKENIDYFSSLEKNILSDMEFEKIYGDLLIEDLLHIPFMNLSSGQKKRVSLYRGLLRNPKLIFFDEFTESLDLKNKITVESIVKNILSKKLHKTIVWVSHSIDEIKNLCNKVIILENGMIKHFNQNFSGDENQMEMLRSELMK